jgi:predicted O-methyltransferase YrrM
LPAAMLDRARVFLGLHGIKKRHELLNYLAKSRGYRRYLEIGVRDPSDNFEKIEIAHKEGVDPAPRAPIAHVMTSDAFFAKLDADPEHEGYDLIFIDGLHLADQVERDVANSLTHLRAGGALVLHDVNPPTEAAQVEQYDGKTAWTGTVWKAWVKLRATRPDLRMVVLDMDYGCGVIERGAQELFAAPTVDYASMTYAFLRTTRRRALNLISVRSFLRADARRAS